MYFLELCLDSNHSIQQNLHDPKRVGKMQPTQQYTEKNITIKPQINHIDCISKYSTYTQKSPPIYLKNLLKTQNYNEKTNGSSNYLLPLYFLQIFLLQTKKKKDNSGTGSSMYIITIGIYHTKYLMHNKYDLEQLNRAK